MNFVEINFFPSRHAPAMLEHCLDLPGEGTCCPEQAMSPTAVLPAAIHHWVTRAGAISGINPKKGLTFLSVSKVGCLLLRADIPHGSWTKKCAVTTTKVKP